MNYIVRVYRTQGNTVQAYNFSDLDDAVKKAQTVKTERFVHKVELSVILQEWRK